MITYINYNIYTIIGNPWYPIYDFVLILKSFIKGNYRLQNLFGFNSMILLIYIILIGLIITIIGFTPYLNNILTTTSTTVRAAQSQKQLLGLVPFGND